MNPPDLEAKIESQPERDKIERKRKCILSFSGSFNPIHTGHVKMLELIRDRLENDEGFEVVQGYIAPSSDDYVFGKLGKEAIGLIERIKMCKLGIQDRSWLSVCPYGIMSSSRTATEIRKKGKIPRSIKIFEIGGADYALKARPWLGVRPFICLGRAPYTQMIKDAIDLSRQEGAVINQNFIFIESELELDVSSTMIRKIMSHSDKEKREEVVLLGLLEKPVYDHLENMITLYHKR